MCGVMVYPLFVSFFVNIFVFNMYQMNLLEGVCHQCNVISVFLEKDGRS